jgi:hypothetical protein
MTWLNGLFGLGIALAIIAQVLAYRAGQRTRQRQIVMIVGIAAAISLFAVGQIAGTKLRDYVSFVNGRGL